MKHLFRFALLFLVQTSLFAQMGHEYQFGNPFWDHPHKVMAMADGSVSVISSYADTNPSALGHVLLYHLSPNGAVLSQKEIARIATSLFVEAEADGTFWLGRLDSIGYGISHHSPDGSVLSQFSYKHPDLQDDYFFAIRRIPGAGFALAFANSDIPQPGVRVVSLSETGKVNWSKLIASSFPDFYNNALMVLPNGRIIVAVIDFGEGYRVACFTPSGTVKWLKGVPQIPAFGEEFGMMPVGSDRFVFYGNGGLNTYNGFAACYDANGNFVWNRTFETELKTFYINTGFSDGDYAVLAGEYLQSPEIGLAVLKLDAQGNVVFKKTEAELSGQKDNLLGARISNGDYIFSSYQWDVPSPGTHVSDQGYALSMNAQGENNWLLFSETKVHLMRSLTTDHLGNLWIYGQSRPAAAPSIELDNFLWKIGGGVPQMDPVAPVGLRIFPTPATERMYLECPACFSERLQVEVYNTTGSLVHRMALQNTGNQASFDVSGLLSGVYSVCVRNEQGEVLYRGKSVIQR